MNARKGYWFRILPDGEHIDDISMATGIEWQYMLPLLTFIGLISWKLTYVVKQCMFELTQWDILKHAIARKGEIQITTVFKKNHRVYYFCVGKPIYKGPVAQEKANAAFVEISALTIEKRQLIIDVQLQAQKLLNRR